MKALIIGGGGFVGPYLVNHLVNDLKWEVTVTKTAKETLEMDNAKVVNLDILDKAQIGEVLSKEQPDSILQRSHLLLILGRTQLLQ